MLQKTFSILQSCNLLLVVLAILNPELHWSFGLINLFLPAFFTVSLLILIWEIVYYKKMKFISILPVLVSSYFLMIGIFSFGSTSNCSSEASCKVQIYSQNLGSYLFEDSVQFNETVKSEGSLPDIICLQEFLQDKNITTDIIGTTSLNYKYEGLQTYSGKRTMGVITMSKHEIIASGIIGTQNTYNTILYTDLNICMDTIRVYNVHLKSYNISRTDDIIQVLYKVRDAIQMRMKQIKELKGHIQKCKYDYIIVGDFNEIPYSLFYRSMSKVARDSYKISEDGLAFTYKPIPSRIDYLFHSNGICADKHQVIQNDLSDHSGLFVELQL